MTPTEKKKAWVKLIFWFAASVALASYMVYSYASGQMVRWYYYTASTDGYAIDANTFNKATPAQPVRLAITASDEIIGTQAVPVKNGQRLPAHTNGVISLSDLKSGKRVALESEANSIRVMVPSRIAESKGFKYRDTFKHKGVRTNPWSGVWNVAMILILGFSLGKFAEGATDCMSIKIEKIDHAIAH